MLERRLDSMGMDGDCAHESAISKIYLDMVEQKTATCRSSRFAVNISCSLNPLLD